MPGIYFVSLISGIAQARSLTPVQGTPSGDVLLQSKLQRGLEKSTRQWEPVDDSTATLLKSYAFSMIAPFFGGCWYFGLSDFPFHAFLKYAARKSDLLGIIREKSNCRRNSKLGICGDINNLQLMVLGRAPDVFLDMLAPRDTDLTKWAARFSNGFVSLLLSSAIVLLTVYPRPALFNQFCFLVGLNALLKSSIENSTGFPPAIGVFEIMRRYFPNIKPSTKIWDAVKLGWTFYPFGTAVEVIPSNHIWNSIASSFFIMKVWRGEDYQAWPLYMVMTLVGLVQGTLLLISKGHYTADVIMGFALAFVLCTHNGMRDTVNGWNPFLTQLT